MSDMTKIEEELRSSLKEGFPSWSDKRIKTCMKHLFNSCPDNPVIYKIVVDDVLVKIGLRDNQGNYHYYVTEKGIKLLSKLYK